MGWPDPCEDDDGPHEDRGEYSGHVPPSPASLERPVVHAATEKGVCVSGNLWLIGRNGERVRGIVLREKWLPNRAVTGWRCHLPGGNPRHAPSLNVESWLAVRLVSERDAEYASESQ